MEAIGRAYMAYAYEFPHYFDFCSRTHGIIQLAMAKGSDLARFAISAPGLPGLSNYAFGLIRTVAQCATPGESVMPGQTPRLTKSPRLDLAKAPRSPRAARCSNSVSFRIAAS